MINIPNDRRHPIASGMDSPRDARELAFKLLCVANDYVALLDHSPTDNEVISVLGAFELAKKSFDGRKR